MIQEGESCLFYTHSKKLNGYVIAGMLVAPDLKARMHFAQIWKYFTSAIVTQDDIYCSVMAGVENTMFNNYLTYHSTIDGLKIYKIDNFLKDKYSMHTKAAERKKLRETMPL